MTTHVNWCTRSSSYYSLLLWAHKPPVSHQAANTGKTVVITVTMGRSLWVSAVFVNLCIIGLQLSGYNTPLQSLFYSVLKISLDSLMHDILIIDCPNYGLWLSHHYSYVLRPLLLLNKSFKTTLHACNQRVSVQMHREWQRHLRVTYPWLPWS